MNIEKFVSYQIERQFPSIYREDGRELVELVTYYYKFLEENDKQSIYNNRRLFEYRDIDSTLEKMVVFFKNKYMKDLPLDSNNTRFIIKRILDLYRRRGTPEGIELFFRLFYDEGVLIYYPAEAMLKPSASNWKSGIFLQLYPTAIDALRDLPSKNIVGSISKSEAIVDRVLFVLANNVISPLVYLNSVRGTFKGYEDILYVEDGGVITNYGKIYGSLDQIEIQDKDSRATVGNNIGDLLSISYLDAKGGKAIVTDVTQSVSGQIEYSIKEPGFGYTYENTLLYVSNQIIFAENMMNSLEVLEYLEDQFGNRGRVIGGNELVIGVRMDAGKEFTADSIITTVRSGNNITIPVESVVPKNESSPGPLYPEDPSADLPVTLTEMSNIETISLIRDIIYNYKDVSLNSINFNTVPPALTPMSGNTDPVTLATRLIDAFDLQPFDVGSIKKFSNIRPGSKYINRVFAVAYDQAMSNFDVYNQTITLDEISAVFEVGGIITQGAKKGKILRIQGNTLFVLPYTYFGFKKEPIYYGGISFNVISVSRDYSSQRIGFNAIIETDTQFAAGKILTVEVTNSGYGYSDGAEVLLLNDTGAVSAVGIARARGQGKIEGRWSSQESHLNTKDGKVIQDSNFYQDFSYEISSKIDINTYKSTLDEIAHLAGTKMFGKFLLREEVDVSSKARITIVRET